MGGGTPGAERDLLLAVDCRLTYLLFRVAHIVRQVVKHR